ncbi:MAG: TIGR04348 family glycosyltransferase [endosymbiont of Galathealinum brachiosum]|uniref:TIGR04348 family glycosyltransferase n=1 Tax=endosymbiont of Galathealinum brachiosum TaxID=2200906 RepID=A0A370DFN6_9GAMM|nr:MAG: TIGR04348 family glycosyltransferase [endosymbiont of Galathealinum brachiosum]
MHIGIITPAAPGSLNGNRATAQRWADFLIELGHKVDISVSWDGTDYDVMLALHAWRSAESIAQFKQKFPDRALVLAMTGTDLYRFINTHPEPTLASIHLADKLVTLHRLADRVLPESVRNKVHVIHQSALPVECSIGRSVDTFDICVVGHLREEKDSMRVAYAVRNLPEESRIRVLHYGKAHNDEWAGFAREEMKNNHRYQWFGEVSHNDVCEAYRRCRLMVLPSVMEGGANVISEATVAGLPVIASNIDGSVGLLGDDYAGYFPVKDENALSEILLKAESDANFVEKLSQQCCERAKLFTVEAEKQGWKNLLNEL